MEHTLVTAVLACAGKGARAGFKQNKLFEFVDGVPVVLKTALQFDGVKRVDKIVIVHAKGEKEKIRKILSVLQKPLAFVEGGKTRFESIKNALQTIENGIAIIHDGARPFVTQKTINACIKSALTYGSGVASAPCVNTVLETDGKGNILASTRKNRCSALTPQAFKVSALKRAYNLAGDGLDFTDDAGIYCAFIGKCKQVESEIENVKLTYKSDFNFQNGFAVGTGFDLHVLAENRKLILGGITIPYEKGLLGHSDADVLTHAIMDALLSAVSERDIGYHFSDKDEKYKDISSMVLLKKVLEIVDNKGYKVNNVSAVIMAEKPKLSGHILSITKSLANALKSEEFKVGITATTLEGIGIVGREEGIASQAYVSLIKKEN